MKVIKNILFASDLFKSPVSLLFSSQIKISTSVGIFISLMIYSFLIASFLNSDFFLRKNPNISDSLISNDKTAIILDKTNFGVLFSLVAENNIDYEYFDPSYLNVAAQVKFFYTETQCRTENIGIVNFTHDTYGRMFPKGLTLEDGSLINLNLTEKNSWNLNYSFLSITLNICNNETSPVVCQPLDEILDYIHGKFFYIWFLEYFYDLNNFEEPTKVNTQNLRYFQLNKNMNNKVSISLMEVGLYQDKNFYLDAGEEQFSTSYQQDSSQYFSYFSTFDKNDIISKKMFEIGRYEFSPSLNKRKILRKYQKMPDAFSQIGGLLTIFKIFGFFCCSLAKYIKILQSLLGKLYQNSASFEMESIKKHSNANDNDDSIALEHKRLQIQNLSLSNSIDMFARNQRDLEIKEKKESENSRLNIKILKNKERLQNLEEQISSKHTKKKFNITFFKYLRYIFFEYFKFKKKEDLQKDENYNKIQILERLYLENFDFLNIIEKINEIEKIKCFLFDSKQKEIFNFISLKHNLKTEASLSGNNGYKEKLNEYIQNIMKHGEFTETDKKLIDLYYLNNI